MAYPGKGSRRIYGKGRESDRGREGRAGAVGRKSLAFSFSQFCRNMHSYYAMKEQGERDLLTGLYNRNRYELDLQELPSRCQSSLACIYLDANGLHELNNSQGHEAGDRMLKAVAEQIRSRFEEALSYRIGGDEFLIFALDQEKDEVAGRIRQLEMGLEEQGFYVSAGAGFCWEERARLADAPEARGEDASSQRLTLEELIKMAEQKMYQAKRAYYEQKQNDRRKGSRQSRKGGGLC